MKNQKMYEASDKMISLIRDNTLIDKIYSRRYLWEEREHQL